MKKKSTKLTYKEMVILLGAYERDLKALQADIFGLKFLLNSYLDMNDDVEKLTEFVEGKIEKEKDASTKGKKEQAKGSRATKTSSEPS
tara:strand:- start:232 stop:495 length:264 start_codon:yes stop_codon:yes gene_type:complete